MQECNETITVLNRRYDPDRGLDTWIPTVLHGVSWFNKIAATVTQDGLKAANTAIVRIPEGADAGERVYLAPPEYKAAESVSGAYTLARGDIIARGDITGGTAGSITPAQAKAQSEDVLTIISVTDSTRRRHGAHRKVVLA